MQWKWDRGRWGDGGKVIEVVEALTKVCHSESCRRKLMSLGDELD
jgi:hypothetical protein